jgi:ATP-dependent Lhr-like helicase
MHDCLTEAMDIDRWLAFLDRVKSGEVKFIPVETREPSPFSHQLLNANPYAFLDGAPLEERRTRAVTTRRGLSIEDVRDLARLDPAAIAQVAAEAWPLVRDADELPTPMNFVVLPEEEGSEWSRYFGELSRSGRATVATIAAGKRFWLAAERWPLVRAVYREATIQPSLELPAALEKDWSASDGWVEILRGQIQCRGPHTAAELAVLLHLEESQAAAALESLEGSGIAMRGQFRSQESGVRSQGAVEWCERRLLARIHRLTLDGLRRRIEPVAAEVYWQYLLEHQHVAEKNRLQGDLGLREIVAQLEGFELPAGVWENKVLAARMQDYDPQWLDHLFLSGELVWGRLRPPKRDEKDGPGMAAMTRGMPMSLALREDLPWLLPDERTDVSNFAGSAGQEILNALQQRGALFFQDLKGLTGLLPTQLEEALCELAALGLVSSDTFAAVRAIDSGGKRPPASYRKYLKTKVHRTTSPIGRWSLFPGGSGSAGASPSRHDQIQRWCKLLLNRYGVLFRDLLARESAAPPWWELVACLRRMELRGEVRGGRFIAGVGGEQFALETAVSRLRDLRDAPPSNDWSLISAADPLNLAGVITAGPRIPAVHKNALVIQRGRCVAAKIAGRIEFLAEIDSSQQFLIRKSLQVGRRVHAAALPSIPEPHFERASRRASAPDPMQLHSRRRLGLGLQPPPGA